MKNLINARECPDCGTKLLTTFPVIAAVMLKLPKGFRSEFVLWCPKCHEFVYVGGMERN